MTAPKAAPAEAIALELREPVPNEIDAGARFSVVVGVKAPATRNLHGAPFTIISSTREGDVNDGGHAVDHPVLSGTLVGSHLGPEGGHDTSARLTATAPEDFGTFTWALVVPAQEVNAVRHPEASLTFSFATRPHATSLAAWDHPSPVVAGRPFTVKVGAKCTAGCALAGKAVDIRDEAGTVLASGTLGETPWPGTTGLYWASVEVQAPAALGPFSRALAFSAAELKLPHAGASATFSAVTIPPPDHHLSITVVDKETQAPLQDAYLRVGLVRIATDDTGLARVAVSAGEHGLSIWKAGYDAPDTTVVVTGDDAVRVEMTALPVEDPFARWNK